MLYNIEQMNKVDEKALRWAIEKYWKSKSDEKLADGLKVSVEEVRQMREEMGLRRESMKEFARRYLLEMSEQDKKEFMSRLTPETIFKMAEGNPHSTEDTTVKHIIPTPIMSLDEPVHAQVLPSQKL